MECKLHDISWLAFAVEAYQNLFEACPYNNCRVIIMVGCVVD